MIRPPRHERCSASFRNLPRRTSPLSGNLHDYIFLFFRNVYLRVTLVPGKPICALYGGQRRAVVSAAEDMEPVAQK